MDTTQAAPALVACPACKALGYEETWDTDTRTGRDYLTRRVCISCDGLEYVDPDWAAVVAAELALEQAEEAIRRERCRAAVEGCL